jgi:hypothetical protein
MNYVLARPINPHKQIRGSSAGTVLAQQYSPKNVGAEDTQESFDNALPARLEARAEKMRGGADSKRKQAEEPVRIEPVNR